MNREQYLAKRKELIAKAQAFIDEGKLEDNTAAIRDVEALDEQYQAIATARANTAALDGAVSTKVPPIGRAENVPPLTMGSAGITGGDMESTDEYKNAWIASLQGKELSAEMKNMVSATDAIPTTTMDKIISRLDLCPLYAAIDVTTIPGNVTYPVENVVADANWVAMATASTDSDDTLTSINLGAHKLIKTIEIGADTKAMTIAAFENWLVERLSNKLMLAIDNAVINGTGANQPTGMLKAGEITQTGTFTKVGMTFKDMTGMLAKLGTIYLQGAKFLMPRAVFFSDILGMTTTDGSRIVVADPQSPAKFNILGYPVILHDKMPADTILFGDFKCYKFNWNKLPIVESDDSVGFRTGSTVYRGLALADGKLGDAAGLCKYTRATA
ncbi:MAG: phage major capsid protein [Angelakisella sp.]